MIAVLLTRVFVLTCTLRALPEPMREKKMQPAARWDILHDGCFDSQTIIHAELIVRYDV
jgi:hypothetical protein